MKINIYIKIACITTFMVLGLNGVANAQISEADQKKNAYIREHTPVVTGFIASAATDTCGYDSEGDSETGSVWPVLENAAENKYNPYISSKSFLGYSNEGSSMIQLKANFEAQLFRYGVIFGDPIPLKAGTYTREATFKDVGVFEAVVTIREEKMDIGIKKSGYTRWDSEYQPEKVYMVEIQSFRMLNKCSWGSPVIEKSDL